VNNIGSMIRIERGLDDSSRYVEYRWPPSPVAIDQGEGLPSRPIVDALPLGAQCRD
jgi:hypothetical protein